MKIYITTLAILLVSLILVSCNGGEAKLITSTPADSSDTSTTYYNEKLSAPILTASLSGSAASLSWNAISTASYYDIYGNEQDQSSTAIKIASPLMSAGISYTGSIGAGTFYYWLKACNSYGCSNFSNVASLIKKAALNDTGIHWGGNYPTGRSSGCTSDDTINVPQDCNHGRDAQAAAGTLEKIGDGATGFDFTKLDASGNALTASATGWSCVRDHVTGLVWEVKVATGLADKTTDIRAGARSNIHHKDNLYRWGGITAIGDYHSSKEGVYHNDWSALVNGSNSASLCGYSDWRVPAREELGSTVDYSGDNPSIDTSYFPNTSSDGFWSASPYAQDSNKAWRVDNHNSGTAVAVYVNRDQAQRLRLVRGGQSVHDASSTSATPVGSQVVKAYIVNEWQDSRYTDNSDDTVTDNQTGLMWKRCPEGQSGASCADDSSTKDFNWKKAREQAQSVNTNGFATHNDWRVPNIKELTSLVALDRYNPAINSTVFPNTPNNVFWSASPYANYSNFAWNVNFGNGIDYYSNRGITRRLRLVRGGQ